MLFVTRRSGCAWPCLMCLACAACLAGGITLGRLWDPTSQAQANVVRIAGPNHIVHSHGGLSIEQVQKLSSLVTSKVQVADVLVSSVQGQTGGMRVALLVRGDLLMGMDLSNARFEAVDQQRRTAVLVLPQPQPTSPRLDHERTRVFEVTSHGLWQIVPGAGGRTRVVELAYAEAQRTLALAAADVALVQRSKTQAEEVISSFFDAAGWSVTVRWNQPLAKQRLRHSAPWISSTVAEWRRRELTCRVRAVTPALTLKSPREHIAVAAALSCKLRTRAGINPDP